MKPINITNSNLAKMADILDKWVATETVQLKFSSDCPLGVAIRTVFPEEDTYGVFLLLTEYPFGFLASNTWHNRDIDDAEALAKQLAQAIRNSLDISELSTPSLPSFEEVKEIYSKINQRLASFPFSINVVEVTRRVIYAKYGVDFTNKKVNDYFVQMYLEDYDT